jgi:hypothetical protein
MSALTVVVAAFMLALVVGTLTWAGPAVVIAIPIAIAGIGVSLYVDLKRKRKLGEPLLESIESSREKDVHFTERDRQSLYSE